MKRMHFSGTIVLLVVSKESGTRRTGGVRTKMSTGISFRMRPRSLYCEKKQQLRENKTHFSLL